jgi:hypothetical protein
MRSALSENPIYIGDKLLGLAACVCEDGTDALAGVVPFVQTPAGARACRLEESIETVRVHVAEPVRFGGHSYHAVAVGGEGPSRDSRNETLWLNPLRRQHTAQKSRDNAPPLARERANRGGL